MNIRKNTEGAEPAQAPAAVSEIDLEQINALAKTPLRAQQVYTFSLRLCDNEIDRDFERFDTQTLSELAPLFIAKAGIFDHSASAHDQTARIYQTEVVTIPGRRTQAGEEYAYLKAKAYMLRSAKNESLIEEIEAGIKKEVSVSCSVSESVCSICGEADGNCRHIAGQVYDGVLCHRILRRAKDAYEWSFVAVPAQREAGILKRYGTTGTYGTLRDCIGAMEKGRYLHEYEQLEAEAAMGRRYMKALRRDVLRCVCSADAEIDGKIFAGALEKLSERELLELQRVYRRRAKKTAAPQLPYHTAAPHTQEDSAFQI